MPKVAKLLTWRSWDLSQGPSLTQGKARRSQVRPQRKGPINRSCHWHEQWQPQIPGSGAAGTLGDSVDSVPCHTVLKPCPAEVAPVSFRPFGALSRQDSSCPCPSHHLRPGHQLRFHLFTMYIKIPSKTSFETRLCCHTRV